MYTVDETIVQQTLRILNAYPSMTLSEVCVKLNKYFSKEETKQRVETMGLAMSQADDLLSDYWPLLIFHGMRINSSDNSLKLVFDKDNFKLISLFKRFALDFGISSRLQKHGSSTNRVFAKLPYPGNNLLASVWHCKKNPSVGWKPFCDHLLNYCLKGEEGRFTIELPRDCPKRFCIKIAGELERHLPKEYKDLELVKWTLYLS